MKQITAVAVAHVTQRPYCINGRGRDLGRLIDAIGIAAEMRARAAYACPRPKGAQQGAAKRREEDLRLSFQQLAALRRFEPA
jgi:ribosomal protein S21